MKLNDTDNKLIELAKEVLQQNKDLYKGTTNVTIASVVLAKSGKTYKGINIQTSHSICSEQVALGQAFACGERELDTLVAVRLNNDGSMRVISPCGLCRYTLEKLGLSNMNVIVEDVDKNKVLKVTVKDLLPYPYKREKLDK